MQVLKALVKFHAVRLGMLLVVTPGGFIQHNMGPPALKALAGVSVSTGTPPEAILLGHEVQAQEQPALAAAWLDAPTSFIHQQILQRGQQKTTEPARSCRPSSATPLEQIQEELLRQVARHLRIMPAPAQVAIKGGQYNRQRRSKAASASGEPPRPAARTTVQEVVQNDRALLSGELWNTTTSTLPISP